MYNIEVLSEKFPSSLKTADFISKELGITAQRLIDLADSGFAPHYRIDGGQPFFILSEFKTWAAKNLVARVQGKDLPEPVKIGLSLDDLRKARKLPVALREVQNLFDITGEYNRSGIYFLCHGNEIQYIGQAICVHSRVKDHARNPEKHFDQVLFLPWPRDDLDRIEGALIRWIQPPANGRQGNTGKITAPGERYIGADKEVLEMAVA